jgi:hypothetical protein
MENLTLPLLQQEAAAFAIRESTYAEPKLFGVTDGKAVGTYLEHKFQDHLSAQYDYRPGSSARGIDFPDLAVDMKVTSIRQPQSSCPFESARQKIYGLGYALLIFVYDKFDDAQTQTARLAMQHVIFIEQAYTADYQTTLGIRQILENDGNQDDLVAFMCDRLLPVDEIQAQQLAEEILRNPPAIGYLTISNALQWRLQYRRAIDRAGDVTGLHRIFQLS